jgi:hypothetical protein
MNLNSLELSIVILSVIAVVSVLGYNAWQSSRGASRRHQGTGTGEANEHDLSRDSGGRDEPVLREPFFDSESSDGSSAVHDSGPDYLMGNASRGSSDRSMLSGAEFADGLGGHHVEVDDGKIGDPVLDPRVECVVTLMFQHALPGDRLIAAAHLLRRAGSKPVTQDACPVSDLPVGTQWEPPRASRSYRALRAGVLLSNRNGPLNGVDFSEFLEGLEALSLQFDAQYSKPDMVEALSRARELDGFCAAQDAQLMIHVDTAVSLHQTDLAQVAAENGLVERGNGRWVALEPKGTILYSMSLGDRPNRVSLLLDLPRTLLDHDPWGAMVECARRLVARLDGQLVDDAAQKLGPNQLEVIRGQLEQRASTLVAADIQPGSPLALRLFN